MSIQNKWEAVRMAISILQAALESDVNETVKQASNAPIEMLTIRECTQVFNGLSEHAVRKLVAQEKIPYIRVGEGKRGKILISKTALMEYLKITA